MMAPRRTVLLAWTATVVTVAAAGLTAVQDRRTSEPPARPAPLFLFQAQDFWLNLHHYLYVLGRARNNAPDASREAVAGAPAEAARGLATLSAIEQQTWDDAVSAYANGLSRRGVLQSPAAEFATALAAAGDAATLTAPGLDDAARQTLARAAPVYRKAWWLSHRAQHQTFLGMLQALVDRHGSDLRDRLTRAYGFEWAVAGYPVHFVAYASAQGNYSLDTPDGVGLLVLSTNPNPMNTGLFPLETVFHEGMHQWDTRMDALLQARSRAVGGASVPGDLSHAIIFFTAGEVIRHVDPAHVPYADAARVWNGFLFGGPAPAGRLKAPLEESWKPYLNGRGTRDEALEALVAKVAGSTPGR